MPSGTIYSCVVDQNPKFAHQALVWAYSLLNYAGQAAESLVIHTIGECQPSYKEIFDSFEIKTQTLKPFDLRHPHSNKLMQLESELLRSADYVVLCDCDIAFCENISSCITGDQIRAKVVDIANLSPAHWKRIFASANLPLPASRAEATFDKMETLPTYCNGGLLVLPQREYRKLGEVWPKWNRWLLERPTWLDPFVFFTDQISLSLSLAELQLSINHLPMEYNFPTHLQYTSRMATNCFPKVLHYHDHVDKYGCLLPTQLESVDFQIKKINALIRRIRPICQPRATDNQNDVMQNRSMSLRRCANSTTPSVSPIHKSEWVDS